MQDAPEWAKEMARDLSKLSEKVNALSDLPEKVDALSDLPEKVDALSDLPEKVNALSDLPEKVNGLSDKFDGLDQKVDLLVTQVGHLVGSDTERRAHGNIVNLASEHLSLRSVRVLHSQIIPMHEELQGNINRSTLDEEVTERQANDLRRSDIIINAFSRTDRRRVHYAIEVSNTIGAEDITRAMDRAETLAIVTGTASYPAVIGAITDDRVKDLARDNNVPINAHASVQGRQIDLSGVSRVAPAH